jgi:hypothetical protein
MSARTSGAMAGRPGRCRRLFRVQTSLKPDRCHRTTVAGWTTETAAAQPRHRWDSTTQSRRSQVRNRGRGALEDGQLVPQREVLEHQGLAGPEHAEEAGEDEGNHAGHHPSDRPKVNADKADGVNRRHSGAPLAPSCLDVVTGSAGAIPAFLVAYRRQRKDVFLQEAVRHGDHLLAMARRSAAGWSWQTLGDAAERDLTGFSHGAAGIAYALLELHHVTGESRFRAGADAGIRYEQQWFSQEHGNWPDFRKSEGPPSVPAGTLTYGLAWCHGAPGIGLARLRAYALCRHEPFRRQAEAAVRSTSKMLRANRQDGGAYTNYALCHGLTGNAELLLYADQVLDGTSRHSRLAAEVARRGVEQYERRKFPWPCGVPGGGETPGLMLGLAGIGHFYLRLHDPQLIPPVLILFPEM